MIPIRHTKDRARIPQIRETLRATLISETFMDFTGMYSLFPGFILAFIVGVVVAKLTPAPSQEVLDEFEAAQNYVDPEEA